MPMKPKEMIKLLEANGFELVDSNGSHHKYRNRTTGKQTIVPVHAKELKKRTGTSDSQTGGAEISPAPKRRLSYGKGFLPRYLSPGG